MMTLGALAASLLPRCGRSSCVAQPSHLPNELWSVQVLPAVCVRMDFSALFAVRDAPGCHRHVIALLQQGTHPFGICVLLTRAHVGDALPHTVRRHAHEVVEATSKGRGVGQDHFLSEQKSHSQALKLRIRIGESPSLSLSKPKNCWLVADMIWSVVSGLRCLSTQSCG